MSCLSNIPLVGAALIVGEAPEGYSNGLPFYLQKGVDALLARSCGFIMCVGQSAESLHDAIDYLIDDYEEAQNKEATVLTTHHAQEMPSEIVQFFIEGSLIPRDRVLVIAIGERGTRSQFGESLFNNFLLNSDETIMCSGEKPISFWEEFCSKVFAGHDAAYVGEWLRGRIAPSSMDVNTSLILQSSVGQLISSATPSEALVTDTLGALSLSECFLSSDSRVGVIAYLFEKGVMDLALAASQLVNISRQSRKPLSKVTEGALATAELVVEDRNDGFASIDDDTILADALRMVLQEARRIASHGLQTTEM